ncbi:PH domain-containing protein [Myroides profundi]|uniref:Membrane protein n=1 Tax=Myroides profundi TaxID=480520 RepID=A0AAJ5BEJ5_MYRPR|nr:PH domain-containing protein [Myroides profundi]AJH14356.1 putative membrane protein [Myroides profundi]SER16655.1 putative membrane protein [Myroides profundi]
MNKNSFYQPTRQATIGIIANFLNALQKIVRAFVPLIVLFLVNKRIDLPISIWGVVILGSILSLGIAYLSYRNFLFYIDEETNSFIIQKGIINKSKVTIQLEKIQQVNLNQSFINKIINVYSVEIDSAGSKDKEATIPSMALSDANALKQILLNYKNEHVIQDTSIDLVDGEQNIIEEQEDSKRISITTLLKVGITSNYLYTLGLILVFFNMVYDSIVRSISIEEYIDKEEVTNYIEGGLPLVAFLYLVVFLVITVLVVNVIRTLLRFWDFKVTFSNKTLLLSHGLLSTQNTIIRPNRVQKIEIEQNYFQKLFDICSLKISQVAGDKENNKKSGLQIPGCSTQERKDLFKIIMAKEDNKEYTTVLKYNYRYLGFRVFLFIVVPLVFLTLFFRANFSSVTFIGMAMSYSVIMLLALYRLYKVGLLQVNEDFIVIRRGIWDISHIYLEPHKIQKIVVSQLWWQQSADVGSLKIYTAGGIVSFSTTQYSELVKLRDKWLYQVESSALHWM